MAHEPETKAEAVIAFTIGAETLAQISARLAVPGPTLRKWFRDWKLEREIATKDAKLARAQRSLVQKNDHSVQSDRNRSRFEIALENFAVKYFGMLSAQADLLADPEYLAAAQTGDIVAHTEMLNRTFFRVHAITSGGDAGDAGAGFSEVIGSNEGGTFIPELVEEDSP